MSMARALLGLLLCLTPFAGIAAVDAGGNALDHRVLYQGTGSGLEPRDQIDLQLMQGARSWRKLLDGRFGGAPIDAEIDFKTESVIVLLEREDSPDHRVRFAPPSERDGGI